MAANEETDMAIGRRDLMQSASLLGLFASGIAVRPARAEKRYGPGASDAEIKIGQTMSYSGPASAYGVQGQCQIAFFKRSMSREASTGASCG
jgi:branched-chain amino acid transport system substrate-binding protein